jgi:hypothetical protein
MTDKTDATDDARYAQVPEDFPRRHYAGAVAGAQPKLLLKGYQGRFYQPGCTPPEVWQRWDICEDLAHQLCRKSLESKGGKRAHMSEPAILEQYLERLLKTGWGTDAEMRWVIRRAAQLANWEAPASAVEPGDFTK